VTSSPTPISATAAACEHRSNASISADHRGSQLGDDLRVLVNPGSTPMSFRQSFLGATGTPQEFTLRNQSDGTILTTSGLTAMLNPNSSLSLILTDMGRCSPRRVVPPKL
jgi:hypothetical protein